ncbi:MAG: cell division protein ZapB [Candidatus Zixiibacteriota bacterium]
MGDKLTTLEKRVDQLVDLVSALRQEKQSLLQSNGELKRQIKELKAEHGQLTLGQTDQSAYVKDKLSGVLGRLEQLEGLIG